ncbi:hypothetical protein N186_05355 [Thermofilum adornatum]|jgi:predicted Zn-ribbon and HTH transcriptional regulator|uniref:Transcriptional regulator n=1 Tax=Thermofilum adornatum TaxID=1365176 RepID=S6A5P1_9CREN|nr:hypothetical protein N186_05355 [Thermofilum adornatum]NAZ25268.1 transcriptional regulator [Thermofilum sp.]
MKKLGEESTTREKILTFFLENKDREISLYELTTHLGLKPSDYKRVLDDINHVAKTIYRKTNGRLVLLMQPPICKNCGYVFKDMEKARLPSKCPVCRSERISPPIFLLTEKA